MVNLAPFAVLQVFTKPLEEIENERLKLKMVFQDSLCGPLCKLRDTLCNF